MKTLRTEIIIKASREKVWDILTNFEKYGDWNPFIREIKGELKLGERLSTTMELDGSKQTFKPVVVRNDSEEAFEWRGSMPLGMFIGQHYFHLEDLGNEQTKLIHGENFSGWLSGFIMKKIGESTHANFLAMNRALKERAEN